MTESDDCLWIKPNDWRSFEAYVAGALSQRFSGVQMRQDVCIVGRHSGTERQIDILIDVPGLIAVECKCYSRRIDVKLVESYLGMLDDLGVRAGLLVTTKGFSKAAIARARNDPRDIDLQVIHPDRLSEYQHIGAPLIYRGDLGISLVPPPFWVADNELAQSAGRPLVFMYPLGHSLESAMRNADVVYGDILSWQPPCQALRDVAAPHQSNMLSEVPGTTFELSDLRVTDERRIERSALLRWAEIPAKPADSELALYVGYNDWVFLLVARSLSRDRQRLEKLVVQIASDSLALKVRHSTAENPA